MHPQYNRSILFLSVFQGSLADAIIMIDGREKPNRQMHVIANRNRQVYDVLLSSLFWFHKGKSAVNLFLSKNNSFGCLIKLVVLVVNFINVSRPHSLGKSHTKRDIKNMYKDNLKYLELYKIFT